MGERTASLAVPVGRRGEGAAFRMRLPCPAGDVTGISLLATSASPVHADLLAKAGRAMEAGTASFRMDGGIILQAPVPFDCGTSAQWQAPGIPGHGTLPAWAERGRPEAAEISLEEGGKVLKGYYKDSLNVLAGADAPYTVHIHLHYRKR